MEIASLFALFREQLLAWGVILTLVTVFELINPRERQALRGRLAGAGFWIVSIALSAILATLFGAAWRAVGVEPLFALPALEPVLGHPLAAAIAAGVLAALVHDFFFYWYHRVQHRWLWRWHAVHHSVRDLSAVNSYHHLSEGLLSLVLLQLPLTLMISEIGPTLPLVTAILWCHIVWIHSPTRVTLGPLRWVLVDNRFHRIHHSLEERHFDKNFGAFTTLWDRIFGTCHMPCPDEWPDVGLADVAQPMGLADWLNLPARLKSGAFAVPELGPDAAILARDK
ncbi:sterol desaturase family protein [Sphingomonas sp.]|uniref:sterol desaturase family protein n=1 Tax=Sphingomonas sp. TaxID=28214 RepID=UPI002E110850|nr:sterol desaturase family protein [Sphingomonas sp.]